MDPEVQRYRRKYPIFPGVQTCVELLQGRNVHGSYLDSVLYDLELHAATYVDELIQAFRAEQDDRVRVLLLAVMAETGLPAFMPLFIENLHADDEVRYWAVVGLKQIDTKEARRALWEAKVQPSSRD